MQRSINYQCILISLSNLNNLNKTYFNYLRKILDRLFHIYNKNKIMHIQPEIFKICFTTNRKRKCIFCIMFKSIITSYNVKNQMSLIILSHIKHITQMLEKK